MPYLIEFRAKRPDAKWLYYMRVSSVSGDEDAKAMAEKYAEDLEWRKGGTIETRITYVKAIELPKVNELRD